MTRLAKELTLAIKAVTQASQLTQRIFNSEQIAKVVKSDKSPVTIADFAAQCCINTMIHEAFPDDLIVAEEDAADLENDDNIRNAVVSLVGHWKPNIGANEVTKAINLGSESGGSNGRFWTLDPIDGTKGFLRGGQYAICLALICNGTVELGVLACPNLSLNLKDKDSDKRGSLLYAIKGEGAFQVTIMVY